MPRRPRIDPPGGYHHVMNRGTDHQAVFFDDRDRIGFGNLLGDIHKRFGIECLAYCLMDNHYHLVLHCPHGGLSAGMQHLSGAHTQRINALHGRDGPLFRGRFRSIPITTDGYLLCAVRYVHRNCLDLPGIANVDGYRWSSHRAYLGHRRPPAWLDVNSVRDRFVSIDSFDEFVREDRAIAGEHAPSAEEVHSLIQLAIGVHDESDETATTNGLDRTIVHLLDADSTHPIRADWGFKVPERGSPAQRRALKLARARLVEQPEIAQMVAMVRHYLQQQTAA